MREVSAIFSRVRAEGRKALLEPEAKSVCMAYGIPVTSFKVAKNEDQAVTFAEEIGFPVVLKIVSPQILHKTDVGGVELNLKTIEDVRLAYRNILSRIEKSTPEAKVTGVLVQEMAPASTEVIIGAIKDSQFGQSVMFGLGGIFAEVIDDVVFRIAPINKAEARSMMTEVKAYPILAGYRNRPVLDTETLVDILIATSNLIIENEHVQELDLNPIMVYPKGAKVVDARIILE
jgi:acetyl-CoA synthetase (ADP-forming)